MARVDPRTYPTVTDIHPGSLLLLLPESFHSLTPDDIYRDYGPPDLQPIRRRDGKPLGPGVPPYAVAPVWLGRGRQQATLSDTKMVMSDFGEAYVPAETPRTNSNTPAPYAPPEARFIDGPGYPLLPSRYLEPGVHPLGSPEPSAPLRTVGGNRRRHPGRPGRPTRETARGVAGRLGRSLGLLHRGRGTRHNGAEQMARLDERRLGRVFCSVYPSPEAAGRPGGYERAGRGGAAGHAKADARLPAGGAGFCRRRPEASVGAGMGRARSRDGEKTLAGSLNLNV